MIYAHCFLPNNLKYDKFNINFLTCQIFSFLLIKEKKLKINLYSNSEYIKICQDLGLNYDNFIDIGEKNKYKNYWSASKMEAIKYIKNEIIIDHDLFLFKDLSNLLNNNDLIYAQNEQIKERKWYYHLLENFAKSIPKNLIPEWDYLISNFYDKNFNLRNFDEICSFDVFNCSILGFKNEKYAKDYAEKSLLLFNYFNKNNEDISHIKCNTYLPTIPEQLFLTFYAKYHNLQAYNVYSEKRNQGIICIHLGSELKEIEKYLDKISNVLNIKYPNIYKNLIKLTV